MKGIHLLKGRSPPSFEAQKGETQILLLLQEPALESRFRPFALNSSLETDSCAGFFQILHRVYAEATAHIQTTQEKTKLLKVNYTIFKFNFTTETLY